MSVKAYLFDWGNTLMADMQGLQGPMCDWPYVRVTEGAEETLAALSRQAVCALATNARDSDEAQIRRALKRAGISKYISTIFCNRTLGLSKPDPAYFQRVGEQLQLPPETMLMVGDDLELDIRGALACGLQAVWFNPRGRPVPEGVRSISRMQQLLKH